jgi:hypothetical protein
MKRILIANSIFLLLTLFSCKNINNYNLNTFDNKSFSELINDCNGKIGLYNDRINDIDGLTNAHKLELYSNQTLEYATYEGSQLYGYTWEPKNTFKGTWSISHDESKLSQSVYDYSGGKITEFAVIEIILSNGQKSAGIIYKEDGYFKVTDCQAEAKFKSFFELWNAITQDNALIIPSSQFGF